jgi:hypothetical protein
MDELVLEKPEKYFWLRSGRGLRSLRELANALPSIPVEEFAYHVNAQKNDFSNWVRDVFKQEELAKRLFPCRTKEQFQTALYNALVQKEIASRQTHREDRHQTDEAALATDPERFSKYHEEKAKSNDELADRFDAVARRFSESMHVETPKALQRRFESLSERYQELRRKVADARKSGKDPFIADLTLRPFASKLEYARVSQSERDFLGVEMLLDEAARELADATAAQEPDVRKEVDRLMRQDESGKRTDEHGGKA